MDANDIDIDRLREDLIADSFGMAVGMGFPGMLVETDVIRRSSPTSSSKLRRGRGSGCRITGRDFKDWENT